MEKRPALGKGLSALIPDAADALTHRRARRSRSTSISSSRITISRAGHRRAKLEDLARSIKANGVIQPIVVRASRARWAGASAIRSSPASAAGAPRSRRQLTQVPIVVKDVRRRRRSGCSRWR
jgi:hypothetical protein